MMLKQFFAITARNQEKNIHMASMRPVQTLRIVLLVIGGLLVIYGAIMMLYFGHLIYEILNHPEKVTVIDYVLKHIKTAGPALYARTPDGQEMYVDFSEPAKSLAFFLMAIMALGVVSGVIRVMIWGGVEIIKVTLSPWSMQKSSRLRANREP